MQPVNYIFNPSPDSKGTGIRVDYINSRSILDTSRMRILVCVVVSLPHHFLVRLGSVYIGRERCIQTTGPGSSSSPAGAATRCPRPPRCLTRARWIPSIFRVASSLNMSPAATIHAQLASIMEALANTAVAEICELVDGGYAVLQLEISRSRKENDGLRRKLRLAELRAARATAMRVAAAAAAGGGGHGPRRSGTPGGFRASNQEAPRCRDPDPSRAASGAAAGTPGGATKATVTVIKVEDDEEEEEEDKEFCCVVDDQLPETEAPPPPTKQEVACGGSSVLWTSGEVGGSASECVHRPEPGGYDCLMYEPPPPPLATQNPLREDPGCSYAANASDPVGVGFPFGVRRRQPPPPAEKPGLPGKEATERLLALTGGAGWRPQDDGDRTFSCSFCGKTLACLKNLKTHIRIHTGEKPFVCPLCAKRFSDSSNLKRHQSVHTGEKRYGCLHCGKRFAQSGSLKVHMAVHTDCKQLRCPYCGKTFISGAHLRRHVAAHAADKRFAPPLQ
ncbi:zinc finger and BTB domain-containing protein 17-like isoform X2 [Pseudoliparis swirei]|uniref:zinc finger and BTB domain-containing protein 17-like isoform X2 n=1 Tax=Pseudoliparis swirei TaxID=2059687 RepID=UPI0024BE6889|nr:zinc finger and BTB domain-containing protein 17-like isoform X2 [Pseudoliparis swirei]